MCTKKLHTTGFTLLEVLLAVAAIGILAGITTYSINPAKQINDQNNTQRKIDVALLANAIYQYTIDHDDQLPNHASWVADTTYLICTNGEEICTDLYLDFDGNEIMQINRANSYFAIKNWLLPKAHAMIGGGGLGAEDDNPQNPTNAVDLSVLTLGDNPYLSEIPVDRDVSDEDRATNSSGYTIRVSAQGSVTVYAPYMGDATIASRVHTNVTPNSIDLLR